MCVLALEFFGLNSFSRVRVCVVVGYGPNEGDCEERDRFSNDMDRSLDGIRNEYRLCILGDQNGWTGDRTSAGITSALEFQERMIMVEEWWSFAKKGDCVWVTHILSTEVCISTQE